MTSIIFWMWLADVAGSVAVLGSVSGLALFLGFAVGGILAAIEEDLNILKRIIRQLWPLGAIVVFACVWPSSSTLRLVAASQAVSVAADTKLGKKSIEAIEAVLEKITKEASK